MKQLNPSTGLRIAVVASLFCHILMFNNIELTFGKKVDRRGSELGEVFFLGSILQDGDYYSESTGRISMDRLNARIFTEMLTPLERSFQIKGHFLKALRAKSSFKKPSPVNLSDSKIVYFRDFLPPKTKKTDSSIMFYPSMPYHFLLYFKNRQTAHMEVAFYISPKGKVLGLKRKISSGNPEVDLLIMRNLIHFLNLCKSNLTLGSWQTVKIDLSP